jgi:hypothetical protein
MTLAIVGDGHVPSPPPLFSRLHWTLIFLKVPHPAFAVTNPDPQCDLQIFGLEFILERNRMQKPPRNPQILQPEQADHLIPVNA